MFSDRKMQKGRLCKMLFAATASNFEKFLFFLLKETLAKNLTSLAPAKKFFLSFGYFLVNLGPENPFLKSVLRFD